MEFKMSKIPYIEYCLILEYLYNIYLNKTSSEQIKISAFFELDPLGGRILPIRKIYDTITTRNVFGFDWFIIDLQFAEVPLWLFCRVFLRASLDDTKPIREYHIDYSPQQEESNFEVDLLSLLRKLAVLNSHLNGKILKINNSQVFYSIFDW